MNGGTALTYWSWRKCDADMSSLTSKSSIYTTTIPSFAAKWVIQMNLHHSVIMWIRYPNSISSIQFDQNYAASNPTTIIAILISNDLCRKYIVDIFIIVIKSLLALRYNGRIQRHFRHYYMRSIDLSKTNRILTKIKIWWWAQFCPRNFIHNWFVDLYRVYLPPGIRSLQHIHINSHNSTTSSSQRINKNNPFRSSQHILCLSDLRKGLLTICMTHWRTAKHTFTTISTPATRIMPTNELSNSVNSNAKPTTKVLTF